MRLIDVAVDRTLNVKQILYDFFQCICRQSALIEASNAPNGVDGGLVAVAMVKRRVDR